MKYGLHSTDPSCRIANRQSVLLCIHCICSYRARIDGRPLIKNTTNAAIKQIHVKSITPIRPSTSEGSSSVSNRSLMESSRVSPAPTGTSATEIGHVRSRFSSRPSIENVSSNDVVYSPGRNGRRYAPCRGIGLPSRVATALTSVLGTPLLSCNAG